MKISSYTDHRSLMWPWRLLSCCPVGTTWRRCAATGPRTRRGCACSPQWTAKILWRISGISFRFVRPFPPPGIISPCIQRNTLRKLKTLKLAPFLPTSVTQTNIISLTSYLTVPPYLWSLLVYSDMDKLSSTICSEWHGPGYMSFIETGWEF